MRHISTYEYEMLQKKLERIEATLLTDGCEPLIKEQFSIEEIREQRRELEQIFRAYGRQVAALETIINDYHTLHASVAFGLRGRFRILNKNLENNAESRALLGLPPYKPGRIKI